MYEDSHLESDFEDRFTISDILDDPDEYDEWFEEDTWHFGEEWDDED